MDQTDEYLGTLLMIEDISDEKRMKSTMSRYIDPGIADKLMSEGNDIMGGQETIATLLFQTFEDLQRLRSRLARRGQFHC